jgi:hypothetical protein
MEMERLKLENGIRGIYNELELEKDSGRRYGSGDGSRNRMFF